MDDFAKERDALRDQIEALTNKTYELVRLAETRKREISGLQKSLDKMLHIADVLARQLEDAVNP